MLCSKAGTKQKMGSCPTYAVKSVVGHRWVLRSLAVSWNPEQDQAGTAQVASCKDILAVWWLVVAHTVL